VRDAGMLRVLFMNDSDGYHPKTRRSYSPPIHSDPS